MGLVWQCVHTVETIVLVTLLLFGKVQIKTMLSSMMSSGTSYKIFLHASFSPVSLLAIPFMHMIFFHYLKISRLNKLQLIWFVFVSMRTASKPPPRKLRASSTPLLSNFLKLFILACARQRAVS